MDEATDRMGRNSAKRWCQPPDMLLIRAASGSCKQATLLSRLACKNARETRCNTRSHRLHDLAMCNVAVHERQSFKESSFQIHTPRLAILLLARIHSPMLGVLTLYEP